MKRCVCGGGHDPHRKLEGTLVCKEFEVPGSGRGCTSYRFTKFFLAQAHSMRFLVHLA